MNIVKQSSKWILKYYPTIKSPSVMWDSFSHIHEESVEHDEHDEGENHEDHQEDVKFE